MHTHIFGEISSEKGHLPEWASDRRSALAQHENIFAPGIRAIDFSGPGWMDGQESVLQLLFYYFNTKYATRSHLNAVY